MSDDSNEAIWRQLWEYYQTPAASSLSRALWQLIAEYATVEGANQDMAKLVSEFLDREVRYHHRLGKLRSSEALTSDDLKSLVSKRNTALQYMIEQAQVATVQTDTGEIARQLLLAECYQQIQQPDKVVAHLEKALADGAEDPLVYFALGYNRFRLALESFGPVAEVAFGRTDTDLLAFQMACLQAVSAFENALTGQDSDSEVYKWIGRVLETAGFEEAATQAFDNADDLSYSDSIDDEPDVIQPGPEGKESASTWAVEMGPITPEEIEEFGRLLAAGKHDIYELKLEREDDEWN